VLVTVTGVEVAVIVVIRVVLVIVVIRVVLVIGGVVAVIVIVLVNGGLVEVALVVPPPLPVSAFAKSLTANEATIGTEKAAPRRNFLRIARLLGSTVRSKASSFSSFIVVPTFHTRRMKRFFHCLDGWIQTAAM